MITEILHSVRESVSVRRVSKAFVVTAFCILLFASMVLVAPISAQESGDPIPQCDEGPPIPDQGEDGDGDGGGAEIAMVNDRSNSMDEGTRFPDLQNATTGFVSRLQEPQEVAEIWFQSDYTVDHTLTTDYQSVIDSINEKDTIGLTDGFPDAIDAAHTELTEGENATDGVGKAMVVATDAQVGDTDLGSDVINESEEAKADGIRVFVVGLGGNVDEQFIEEVASSPDDAYIDPGSGELDTIYEEISEEVEDIEQESQLTIDTRSLFQPGETHEYTVTNTTVREDGTIETQDVTGEASVNTSNTSLLTANEQAAELTATDDANASAGVVVTAEHNGETGCVNAIVAQASMENLDILPTVYRVTTFLGDWTVFLFIVSIGAGIVGTRIATSFMGLSMMELVLIVGWFGGYISTGLILTSVFAVLFIGLNLAANIDYQVQR